MLGRQRLVFLGDTSHPELADRHAGFVETLEAAGATLVASVPTAFTFAAGVQATQTLLSTGRRSSTACSRPATFWRWASCAR